MVCFCADDGSGNVPTTVNRGDPQCLQEESFEAIPVISGHLRWWLEQVLAAYRILCHPLALPSRVQENQLRPRLTATEPVPNVTTVTTAVPEPGSQKDMLEATRQPHNKELFPSM